MPKKVKVLKKRRPKKTKNYKVYNKKKDNAKTERIRFHTLRGMKDILPSEYNYWRTIKDKAKELAEIYSFSRIDTPILEQLSLIKKTIGQGTDIVDKELFSFVDVGGEHVVLRPDTTVPLARSFIEHGMYNQLQPVKLFFLGPLFRYERPQSGILRQHSQFSLEVFGESSPAVEVQLILIAYNFFKELGIDINVQINSLGCSECRGNYRKQLLKYYKNKAKKGEICQDCKRRLKVNPLRVLDCKEEMCQSVIKRAPQIVDWLCEDCHKHFTNVLEYLDELNIPYILNPYLVRGLDYYTRTVFEFYPVNKKGDQTSQKALGGGGRYDNLIESMGGGKIPACGFGIGIERTILEMKQREIKPVKEREVDIFLAQLGDLAKREAFHLFEELRHYSFRVSECLVKDSLKAQLKYADKIGAKFTLILGQKEMVDKTIIIRDMESGAQEIIDRKKLLTEIEKKLKNNKK